MKARHWRFAAIYQAVALVNITINAAAHRNDPGEVLLFIAGCWSFSALAAAIAYFALYIRNQKNT